MDWEAVFRSIGSPALILAPDHTILSANDTTCHITGKTGPELRGMKCWEVFHGPEAMHPPPGCPMAALLSSKKPETAEIEVSLNGGVCLVSCTPVFDDTGAISTIIHLVTDITREKNADESLRESEDRFRKIFENSPLGLALVTPDFHFFSVNPVWVSMTGYSETELLKMSFKDITHPDHLAGDLEHIRELAAGKIPVYSTEKRYIRKDGSILWGLIRVTTIRDNQGSLQHFAAQIEDITERKHAEELLRESENKFSTVFRNSPVALTLVSASDGIFIDVNDAFLRNSGYTRDDIIGKTTEQVGLFPDAGERGRMVATLRNQQHINSMELKCRIKNGEILTCQLSSGFILMGEKPYIISTIENISDRKHAEDALRESEEKYRTVFENTGTAMVVLEENNRISLANEEFVKLSGFSRNNIEKKKCWTEFVVREDLERMLTQHRLRRQNHNKALTHYEFRFVTKSGDIRDIFLTIDIIPGTKKSVASLLDITGRRQADEALRERESSYRTLAENLPGIVYRVHVREDGRMQFFNPLLTDMTGYTVEELTGGKVCSIEPLIVPEDRDRVITEVDAAIRENRPFQTEYRLTRKDGSIRFFVERGQPVFDDRGLLSIDGIIQDITDSRRAEEALNKAHALLNETQEISHLGGWEYDVASGRIMWTAEVYRIHGVRHDFDPGAINRDIQFYTQKDSPVIEQAFRRCCEQGEPYDLELELIRADGRQIWVRTMGKPVLQDGRIVRVHGNIIDITERKQAEDALRQRTEELDNRNRLISTLLDTVPIGIFMVEAPSGRPIIANREATRLLGRGILPDVTETSLAEVYEAYKTGTAEKYPTPEMPVVRGLDGESSHIDDMEVVRPDGTRVLLEIFGNPITDSHNRVVASLVSFLDITDRKQADELRERFIRELARKNADLDRFTYTVSHDLKSPLVAIRAYVSLLGDDLKSGDDGEVQKDITRIGESAEKLELLITTLLALSRSGKSVDAPVRMPFSDLAREAAGLLDTTLRDRGITLVIPESLPAVSGDRVRLLQVMTNLLDNAVKFMGDQKEPRIEIGIRDELGTPLFFVKDNGMGIKTEYQPKLFGLFERFSPEIPGTGIGLATVKRIIEAHGGKIWVESEGEGKGTTVCFTLPGVTQGNKNDGGNGPKGR